MRLTGAVGFVLAILGIAGLDGAIYFGTGYLTATACLLMGAAGLYIDYRLEGPGEGGKRPWDIRHALTAAHTWIRAKHATAGRKTAKSERTKKNPPGDSRAGSEKINAKPL